MYGLRLIRLLELRVRIAKMLKRSPPHRTNSNCNSCVKKSTLISNALSLFINYIRHDFQKVEPTIQEAHRKSRQFFNLPPQLPKAKMALLTTYALRNEYQNDWI